MNIGQVNISSSFTTSHECACSASTGLKLTDAIPAERLKRNEKARAGRVLMVCRSDWVFRVRRFCSRGASQLG
jgi:hypothetical protein